MNTIVRGSLFLALLAIAVVAIVGCDGDWCDDGYYYDGYYYDDCYDDRGSLQKTLFVYLNVAAQDGGPLEGATVWVDGQEQRDRTEAEYDELGDQFPSGWRGWEYNWSGGPYFIDLRDCSNRRCTIEILVSKTGYDTQRTTITLRRDDPDEVYMRQTIVMDRRVGPANAQTIIDAPQPPEMIALTHPHWRQ